MIRWLLPGLLLLACADGGAPMPQEPVTAKASPPPPPVDAPVVVATPSPKPASAARVAKKKPKGRKRGKKILTLDEVTIEGIEDKQDKEKREDHGVDEVEDEEERAAGPLAKDGDLRTEGEVSRPDDGLLFGFGEEDAGRAAPPARFLPRVCYFENTYLGGNAAHAEHLRRLDADFGAADRPYREATLSPQPFDAPGDSGLALSASLDRRWIDKPGRVVLQIGLQGSERFGWRRPPIDVALVVDRPVLANDEAVLVEAVTGLVRRLGPQDRLAVVLVGPRPVLLAPLGPVRDVRKHLAKALEHLTTPPAVGPAALAGAMAHAGDLLATGSENSARVPGAQTVLLLTHGGGGREQAAQQAAHDNNLRGLQNSVIDLSRESGNDWWSVANAGYGNFHQADPEDVLTAIDAELESLSRVIARLLRLNVRLSPNVEAIRVLGSRVLGQREVVQVKAREETTDRQLSRALGVKADRGDDDDGIQTVIPYFYGGDAHVVLIELWVTKPGPVADVTLKFKDMVRLANGTARASAALGRLPRPETPAERAVKKNVSGFAFAAALDEAAGHSRAGRFDAARRALRAAAPSSAQDRRIASRFQALLEQRPSRRVGDALALASQRRVGHPP